MLKVSVFILAVVAVGLAAALGIVVHEPAVSTVEIDRDRVSVTAELSSATSEADKYEGGLVKALLSARVETLRHTLAMLDQKRTSLIRRIALDYTIDSKAISPASDEVLNGILDELRAAEARIMTDKKDAEKYSGGLVHGLKLATIATEELSAAQLRMRFYTAKYGLALPSIAAGAVQRGQSPPGAVVDDKEAL